MANPIISLGLPLPCSPPFLSHESSRASSAFRINHHIQDGSGILRDPFDGGLFLGHFTRMTSLTTHSSTSSVVVGFHSDCESSSESASEVVRAFYAGINNRDLASVDKLIAENCVYEDLIFPRPFTGRENLKMCVILRKQREETERRVRDADSRCSSAERCLLESTNIEKNLRRDVQLLTAKVGSLESKFKETLSEKEEIVTDFDRLQEKTKSVLSEVVHKTTIEIYNNISSRALTKKLIDEELKNFQYDENSEQDEQGGEDEERRGERKDKERSSLVEIIDEGVREGRMSGGDRRPDDPRARSRALVHSADCPTNCPNPSS